MDLNLRITLQFSAAEFNRDASGYPYLSPLARSPEGGDGWGSESMEATRLQTLNLSRSPLHLRPAALAWAFPLSYSKRRRRRPLVPLQSYPCASPLCLHSASRSGISSTERHDDASGLGAQAKSGKLLQVVLVSPQIQMGAINESGLHPSDTVERNTLYPATGSARTPVRRHKRAGSAANMAGGPHPLVSAGTGVRTPNQIAGNTGCIARTCAATAVGLHLVEPLGYKVDDTKLKRAGLDYWPYPPVCIFLTRYVVVKIHSSWAEFRDYFQKQEGEKRLLAFTKRGTRIHSDFSYKPGDWLVFGSETSGLPAEALLDCSRESMGGGTIRIPMVETYVRCLNLSVSVGIALYEASRQLNYEQLQCPPMIGEDDKRLFNSEDIYA
ncbi:hypothetical protein Taro_022975 [Colocasia esculenta]|uniref:tRNA/rRNA methyltransferase SpoU type domain-containing protein n=1 Tax=Colocasia esculenta TaxID=4460 RepID=A0A843V2N8_COLES|nr:hypothetical protein [Colocasia esculenta]